MKELPNPVYALAQLDLRSTLWPGSAVRRNGSAPLASVAGASGIAGAAERRGAQVARVRKHAGGLSVQWASHQDDVRAAQRLRHDVFATEMGARLSSPMPGHDIDRFDDFCEHLLVRDELTQTVIGTYRVLTPSQAVRAGGTYTDTEFDLARLHELRPRMVELGRSCVHADHRHGGVVLALWGALAAFMHRNKLDVMIGCASIPMQHNGIDGGHAAASIWRRLSTSHMAPVEHQVQPRLALPIDRLDGSLDIEPPALIRGYLRLGARLLGAPAWDPDFNSADLPMLMRIEDMPARYRSHFLGT